MTDQTTPHAHQVTEAPLSAAEIAAVSSNTRKVYVKTYGCQMNVYDSQRMADSLANEGYVTTDSADDADMVLINTCHIREKASEKLYSALGRLRDLKHKRHADGKDLIIGVAGCVAQAEGDEILRRSPTVDLVVGPQTYHRCAAGLIWGVVIKATCSSFSGLRRPVRQARTQRKWPLKPNYGN